ncbi:MAG TPA: hypothetical protein VJS37_14070 [Terriglobales bacterium]|nr:hypothetical protein [Terriglobales bacterium]
MDKTGLPDFPASFFAPGYIRAHAGSEPRPKTPRLDFFRKSGRLKRLRRSRWQWLTIVAIILVLRVQHQLPPAVEIMVGMMLLIFLVAPVKGLVREGK